MTNQNNDARSSVIDPASFILVDCVLGALIGVIVGSWLDHPVENSRVIALISALAGVAGAIVFREFLGRFSHALSFRRLEKHVPAYLWISIGLSAIIGAFAGHDLCELFGDTSGITVGLVSGTLAAASKATLTILYFYKHPQRYLDF